MIPRPNGSRKRDSEALRSLSPLWRRSWPLSRAAILGCALGFRATACCCPAPPSPGLPGGQSVDLSGLDANAAARLLEQRLESNLSSRSLTVSYGDGKSARLEGDLLEADPSVPIDSALAAKDSQPFYMLGLLWLGLGDGSQHTASALALTEAGRIRVESLVGQIAQELYVAPVDFTYALTDESVELTLGTDGQQVDQEALVQAIIDALTDGQETLTVTT